MKPQYEHALIVGAGAGLSASLARRLRRRGMAVTLARRSSPNGDTAAAALHQEMTALGVGSRTCDVADRGSVDALFAALEAPDGPGAPDVVVFNPSARARGSILDLDPEEVARAVQVSAVGGFYVAQAAARRMAPRGHGALLFTGASASVKGFANSAPFAMGKFALRGLAQSLARELHPRGVHVGHFVIDGAIRNPARGMVEAADAESMEQDRFLDPDAIAATYETFLDQDRSAWAWEIELRPWVEKF